jgi:hypothetical protein
MSIAYDYSREAVAPVATSKPRLLLIDGRQVPSRSGRSFKTLNPATERVIATVAEGNEADTSPSPPRGEPSKVRGGPCARRNAGKSCSASSS